MGDEIRRIGFLIDVWLKCQNSPGTNPEAEQRAERRLHDAIKDGPLFGKILSFAGLNLWVDDRKPEGSVALQESIYI